eukprot:GFUD01014778.1.p1 GENE.GFUD01014778.1~~GFUD01014778.1.p1  ORF type:complete len:117 (-),score=4.98 GFUD01014778.1:61-411(-)
MYAVRMLSFLFFIGCFDLDMDQAVGIVGSTAVAKPCIFPFKYDVITYYNKCTTKYSKPWCATEVVSDCDWAHCADGCTVIVGCQTGYCATGADEGVENQVFEGEWVNCLDGCFGLG